MLIMHAAKPCLLEEQLRIAAKAFGSTILAVT